MCGGEKRVNDRWSISITWVNKLMHSLKELCENYSNTRGNVLVLFKVSLCIPFLMYTYSCKIMRLLALGFPGGASCKELSWQCQRNKLYSILSLVRKIRTHNRWSFDPWVRKIPWRKSWQPIPVILAWWAKVTLWMVARQASLSMGFSKQE